LVLFRAMFIHKACLAFENLVPQLAIEGT
jgi:hypothetical protein